MHVVTVPVGSTGIDCTTVLTHASAVALKAAGVSFAVRYLGGLSAQEVSDILGAGLGLQLINYSKYPGWEPSAALGTSEGQADVGILHSLQIPRGMLVWIDLEGSGGNAVETAAWAEARAAVLVAGGYVAGLYAGNQCVLNGHQLFALASVTRYWSAYNSGIPEPSCGFCQRQLYPPDLVLAGIEVDFDVTQHDYSGRAPMMLVG